MRLLLPLTGAIISCIMACSDHREHADLVLTGGTIYCVDPAFSKAEAVAIRNGKFLATGTGKEILKKFAAESTIRLDGMYVYPGWIDAHCHFYGYGMNLTGVDLAGTRSPGEVIALLEDSGTGEPGKWITGRGWDQNDWEVKVFPGKEMLDAVFPDTPVFLRRIDGHAAWVNSTALRLAGVTAQSVVDGGKVVLRNGEPTGILIDNAMNLVASMLPRPDEEAVREALLKAQDSCFKVGLTSVQDAGLDRMVVEQIRVLQEKGSLMMRINAWLHPTEENYHTFVEKGPFQNDLLTVNTIKLYADGALGSRGAWMIEPYSDDPGNRGLATTTLDELEAQCRRAYSHHFAVATHCIGDRANHEVLELYARILGGKNDRRWRIEHAQVVDPADFHLFRDYSIIPSVQTTHATSDMDWAEDRLGPERIGNAYATRKLMEQNGWIANGSDFPVESVNPLYGFYAAVSRKDLQGNPPGGFLADEALSRAEALCAMTIWAARAGREEHLKGSIEPGKLADFVVTGRDLMNVSEGEIPRIRVLSVWSGGKQVYGKTPD